MAMQITDYTPDVLEEVVAVIQGEPQKEAARQVARLFLEAGLTVKIKQYQATKMRGVYRLLCFIQKHKEDVIVNTNGFDFDGMSVQVRIVNPDALTRLDELSEGIRNQIINGNDCRFCWDKCDGKRYQFTYNGTDYVKCHMLCSNFRFQVENAEDADSIIKLIEREIAFAAAKRKK